MVSYLIYLLYTVMHKDDTRTKETEKIMPTRQQRRELITVFKGKEVKKKPILKIKDFVILIVGVAGLALGAKYLIDSVVELSGLFNIAPAMISITAVAIGTSLPELIVSIKVALSGKSEIAIGNIFGSNAFNALVVVGLPGIFKNLVVDEVTFSIGVPAMALATLLFIISGISRRIHIWDGAIYLILYILFIGKLFNLF
ncbi:MAG TPA: sodium:calcium antiporter [Candidatus Moranbacteria bacterium]|nr:sodium:calcium antiporter [Candidatus Moranbacteria bacterium]